MKLAEAKKIIAELKGRFDAPFGSSDKSTIENLYYEVTGKSFISTSCQQCYHDGLLEIYYHIKKYGKMAEKSNYRLRAGAIINCPTFMGGKVFSNDNLTDKVAQSYLEQFPDNVDLFQKIPESNPDSGDGKGKGGKKSNNNPDAGDGKK